MKKPKPLPVVLCGEDGTPAECISGQFIWPRRPDLWKKWFWVCPNCKARVGCHEESKSPMGSPASPATQQLRRDCHARLDALWREKMRRTGCPQKEARRKAYLWLSDQLGVPPKECHIGMFNAERCLKALEILDALYRSSP